MLVGAAAVAAVAAAAEIRATYWLPGTGVVAQRSAPLGQQAHKAQQREKHRQEQEQLSVQMQEQLALPRLRPAFPLLASAIHDRYAVLRVLVRVPEKKSPTAG